MRARWARPVACACLVAACGEPSAPSVGEGTPAPSANPGPPDLGAGLDAKADAPRVEPPLTPLDPAATLHLTTVDPRVVARLDAPGKHRLVDVLARLHREQGWAPGDVDGHVATWSSWATITAALRNDVVRLVADMAIDWETDIDRTYDRSAAKTPEGGDAAHRGNGNVARVLDVDWFSSPRAHLPLVAVVYRPDRADFVAAGCGELRLVYRLAYLESAEGATIRTSRLPVTVNVVLALADDGAACRTVARSFAGAPVTDDASAALLAGALDRGPLAGARVQQIETNAQLVRFPSDLERVDGRGFAGQAAYGLRIFAPRGQGLAPVGLENTPDVLAIAADPGKRAVLLASLRSQRDGIEQGVFRLPDELLATVALSWSTHGSARAANRPFAALLDDAAADALLADWPGPRTFVTDRAALRERLDTATCMGCHQASSTAGFHVLGVDRAMGDDEAAWAEATDGNRLALAMSPHMLAEQPRRRAYATALANGDAPVRTRVHPSAPAAAWREGAVAPGVASVGMPCPLHAADGSAAGWSCAAGSRCVALVTRTDATPVHGTCMPDARADVHAGMACRAFAIEASPVADMDALAFNARAFLDVARETARPFEMDEGGTLGTQRYNCRPAAIGVPLGRVTRRCTTAEWALQGTSDAEVCAIVGGKGFEQMATGAFDAAAFAASTGRGLLDRCDASRPCREDYICQRLPSFLAGTRHRADATRLAALQDAGTGFCTPTYFVYQLRLDGHPKP